MISSATSPKFGLIVRNPTSTVINSFRSTEYRNYLVEQGVDPKEKPELIWRYERGQWVTYDCFDDPFNQDRADLLDGCKLMQDSGIDASDAKLRAAAEDIFLYKADGRIVELKDILPVRAFNSAMKIIQLLAGPDDAFWRHITTKLDYLRTDGQFFEGVGD